MEFARLDEKTERKKSMFVSQRHAILPLFLLLLTDNDPREWTITSRRHYRQEASLAGDNMSKEKERT